MLKKILILGLLLYVMGLGRFVQAQEDYRLGSEDAIEIRVWDHDDLTRKTRVGLNGMISFPFVGEIKARGLTIAELQKELESRLGPKYIIDPRVSITIGEYKSQKFFVVGNVQKPGTFPLTKPIKIVEAISMAGGIASGTGSRPLSGAVAIIIRAQPGEKVDQPKMPEKTPAGAKTTVSATGALAGDVTQNLEIKNGDTIFIPNFVYYVTGEVKGPNRFPYEENLTVLMAVTTVGGFSDKASQRGIYIVREIAGVKKKVKVNLDDHVKPGDTIVVPESWF